MEAVTSKPIEPMPIDRRDVPLATQYICAAVDLMEQALSHRDPTALLSRAVFEMGRASAKLDKYAEGEMVAEISKRVSDAQRTNSDMFPVIDEAHGQLLSILGKLQEDPAARTLSANAKLVNVDTWTQETFSVGITRTQGTAAVPDASEAVTGETRPRFDTTLVTDKRT